MGTKVIHTQNANPIDAYENRSVSYRTSYSNIQHGRTPSFSLPAIIRLEAWQYGASFLGTELIGYLAEHFLRIKQPRLLGKTSYWDL